MPGDNTAEGQTALFGLLTRPIQRCNWLGVALPVLPVATSTPALALARSLTTPRTVIRLPVPQRYFLIAPEPEASASGALALLSNTIGNYNTAIGAFALLSNGYGVETAPRTPIRQLAMGPFKIISMVVQTPLLVLVRFKTAPAITTPRWAPEQAPPSPSAATIS